MVGCLSLMGRYVVHIAHVVQSNLTSINGLLLELSILHIQNAISVT